MHDLYSIINNVQNRKEINNPNRRMKYINIKYYYFREYVKTDIVDPHYVPTNEMLADGLTKALNRLKFNTFAASIGMHG